MAVLSLPWHSLLLSLPRRGRPGFEDLSRRPVCAAPGLLRGQLLPRGQGRPRDTHPDPIVSMGDPGRPPCGVGDKEEWPRPALPRPVSMLLPHRPGPQGHGAHSSDPRTCYARSREQQAAEAGQGAGSEGWDHSEVSRGPGTRLSAPFLPTILVSAWLPQPLLLPRRAPGHRVLHSQVAPSAQRPAKPSPTHSLHSGFDCVAYPLWSPKSGGQEPRAALESAKDPRLPTGDLELASDTSRGHRAIPSGLAGECR